LAKAKRWTYFSPEYKARKVDEFCAWYVDGNADKVRTWNMVSKKLSEEEKDELVRLHPDKYIKPEALTAPLADWEREPTSFLSSIRRPKRNDDGGFIVLDQSVVPDFINEQTEDLRFKNLQDLVHQYSDIIKSTDERRDKEIVPELWGLIGLLSEEKRIDKGAGFKLEPYREVELQRLEGLVKNLQAQFDKTDKFLEKELPPYISWKRKHP